MCVLNFLVITKEGNNMEEPDSGTRLADDAGGLMCVFMLLGAAVAIVGILERIYG
jgi:hypothetical protein